jgi:hypothetical protein
LEAGRGACLIQVVRQATVCGEVHELAVGEIGHAHVGLAGQRVVTARADDYELLDTDRQDGPLPLQRDRSCREVGQTRVHGRDEVVGVPELDQVGTYLGVVAAQGGQGGRQHADADGEQRADVQLAGDDAGGPFGGAAHPLRVGQAGPGVGEDCSPGWGEADFSRQAFEQRAAQLAFQREDLVGQAWLADVEHVRGPGERAFVDHGHEVLELAQRDRHAQNLSKLD